MNKKYEAWPLGRLRKEWQRTELEDVKSIGYDWGDPRDVVDAFEEEVAKLTGSKYAVAVDCCSHGLFLSMKYLQYMYSTRNPLGNNMSYPTFYNALILF